MILRLSAIIATTVALHAPALAQNTPVSQLPSSSTYKNVGRLVIPLQFDDAWPFADGVASVRVKDKWGLIDTKGGFVVKPSLPSPPSFSEGFAAIYMNTKWGFIDTTGRLRIPAQFDGCYAACSFSGGLGLVIVGGRYGFINTSGAFAINPKFEDAFDFKGPYARVKIGGKWGVIDRHETFVIKPRFDNFPVFFSDMFSDGLLPFQLNGHGGYVNKNDQIVIPPTLRDVRAFSEGVANVVFDDFKWGYINTSGAPITSTHFEAALPFSSGLAAVKHGDRWGYISHSGQFTIPAQFDDASSFSKYGAWVGIGGSENNRRWGLINSEGKFLINPIFERVNEFADTGFASVKLNGKWGLIDTTGQFVIDPVYQSILPFSEPEGLALVNVDGKNGFISR